MKNIDEAIKHLKIYPSAPSKHNITTDWHGYHKSKSTSFAYAEKGSFAAVVGEHTYIVREHQLILFPTNVSHMYWKIPSDELSVIRFPFRATIEGEDFFTRFGLADKNHVVSVSHENILRIFNEMITPKGYTNNISIRVARCTGISELLAIYMECRVKSKNMKTELSEIISYMENHLAEDISISKLASIAHLNPNYFINYFTKIAGITPMKYLAHLRAQHAAKLIKTTDLPLKDVASSVGINDIYYFKTFFEKNIGVSPDKYKEAIEIPSDRPHMKTATEYVVY